MIVRSAAALLDVTQASGRRPPELIVRNEFSIVEGVVPDAIPLIPAPGKSRIIQGRDGREFLVPDLATLLEGQAIYGMDPPLDWEHESERWWSDDRAPAAAWIKEIYEEADSSIWARVEWTEEGAESVRKRAYRYISPTFRIAFQVKLVDGVQTVDWEAPPVVVHITSAALTNRPNLHMPALNHQHGAGPRHLSTNRKHRMDLATLAALLGLSASATEAEITRALQGANAKLDVFGLKLSSTVEDAAAAKNKLAEVDLDKYVPADLHTAEVKARKEAQDNLAALQESARKSEVEGWLQANLEKGKILPTQLETLKSMALSGEQAFNQAKQLVEAAPERLGSAPVPKAAKEGEAPNTAAIPDHIKATAKQCGQNPVDLYAAYREDLKKFRAA